MKTFNIDLWQDLRNIIIDEEEGTKFLDGKIYFGLTPENTNAPYCVMHVLDTGDDNSLETLCKDDENYNIAGISDIQFTIYSINDMQLDEILFNLNNIIKGIKSTNEYRILSSERTSTRTASSFSNEVGTGLSRFTFKYEHL